MTPGQAYEPSGKIITSKAIGGTIVSSMVAIGIGLLYGLITEVDPLIYLNILVLIAAVVGVAAVATLTKKWAHSRNKTADTIITMVICFFAWYAQWVYYYNLQYSDGIFASLAHPGYVLRFVVDYANNHTMSIGRFGSDGLPLSGGILFMVYLVELAVFFVPVYFVLKEKDYYCENCERHYETITAYFEDGNTFSAECGKASMGNFSFVATLPMRKSMGEFRLDPKQKPLVGKVEYHYCPQCRQASIIDASTYIYQLSDKGKKELVGENHLSEATYVDDATSAAIVSAFLGKTMETPAV